MRWRRPKGCRWKPRQAQRFDSPWLQCRATCEEPEACVWKRLAVKDACVCTESTAMVGQSRVSPAMSPPAQSAQSPRRQCALCTESASTTGSSTEGDVDICFCRTKYATVLGRRSFHTYLLSLLLRVTRRSMRDPHGRACVRSSSRSYSSTLCASTHIRAAVSQRAPTCYRLQPLCIQLTRDTIWCVVAVHS